MHCAGRRWALLPFTIWWPSCRRFHTRATPNRVVSTIGRNTAGGASGGGQGEARACQRNWCSAASAATTATPMLAAVRWLPSRPGAAGWPWGCWFGGAAGWPGGCWFGGGGGAGAGPAAASCAQGGGVADDKGGASGAPKSGTSRRACARPPGYHAAGPGAGPALAQALLTRRRSSQALTTANSATTVASTTGRTRCSLCSMGCSGG